MSTYLTLFLILLTTVLIDGSPFYLNEEITTIRDEKKTEQPEQPRIFRLGDDVQPISYNLKIIPDLKKFTFSGKVEINILVKFSTNQITLHSSKLTIKSCILEKDGKSIDNKIKLDEINDLLIVQPAQQLTFDTKYTLTIEFEGTLGDDMTGFYKSSYIIDGQENWLATTQFEATYAREAFPCFDEPRFRTPFTISVAHFTNQKATSNMPIEIVSNADFKIEGRRWTTFKPTPPMATYLVAFMISDFTYSTDSEQRISVWTRKNAIQHSYYALKQSTKLLKQLEGYTGISYNLPKLDVVAVPDFDAGAMENWGMTTYRESAVLVNELTSSETHKSRVTEVICHEFSHQWFGDLVTPAWWDYTWLNEGFARYFQYFATMEVEPSWKLDHRFVVETVQGALWGEITTQRAMTTSVKTKKEIDNTFDVISYPKAASVLRMFEHVLSSTTFKSAIYNYLKTGHEKHGGTVVPALLYEAMDEQAYRDSPPLPPHVSASQVFRSWTENIGFPLIKVTRDYNNGKTKIEQTAYRSPRASKPAPDQEWIVPLTYTTKSEQIFSNTQPSLWSFANKVTELPKEVAPTDWVLFNLQHAGYYRVQYDKKNWNLLINQLLQDHNKIHILNRAELLDDSLALAYDEKLCYHVALRLTQYLSNEIELIPWLSATGHLNLLLNTFEGTSFHYSLQDFIQNIMKNPYEKLGFEIKSTDDHLTKVAKPIFISLACNTNVGDCVPKALQEYSKNAKDLSKIQPDLKPVVFCAALKQSGESEDEFNNLWNEYLKSNIAYDKNTILQSLTCSKNYAVHVKLIKKLTDSKNKEIRKQDRYLIQRMYSSNTHVANIVLDYLLDQISQEKGLSELDDYGIKTFEHIINSIGKNLKHDFQADMLEKIENKLIKINQKKYENLAKAAHNAYTNGRKTIMETKKRGEALEGHLKDLLHPSSTSPPAQTTKAPSSGASSIISSLWSRFTIAIIALSYTMSMLGVL